MPDDIVRRGSVTLGWKIGWSSEPVRGTKLIEIWWRYLLLNLQHSNNVVIVLWTSTETTVEPRCNILEYDGFPVTSCLSGLVRSPLETAHQLPDCWVHSIRLYRILDCTSPRSAYGPSVISRFLLLAPSRLRPHALRKSPRSDWRRCRARVLLQRPFDMDWGARSTETRNFHPGIIA